jgi:hypothetical protein
MKRLTFSVLTLLTLLVSLGATAAHAQWHSLTNSPTVGGVTIGASTMLLLTDGTVMVQEGNGARWYLLTPDAFGSYQNGTFTALPSMHKPRLYYASSVLADGRVIVAGAEYTGTDTGVDDNTYEIYDPVANFWTPANPVPGFDNIGDAPCSVLANGRFLLGSEATGLTVQFDPTTNTWGMYASKNDRGSEESWVLLPDQTVLTAEVDGHPAAAKYLPGSNLWVGAGTVTPDVVDRSEIGSLILRPNGKVVALGANGNTSIYTPPANPSDPGTWVAGPTMPLNAAHRQLGCRDTPGVLLPNGNILFTVGPVDVDDYVGPTSFLLTDGTRFRAVPHPGGTFDANAAPYGGRMLLLPTGQVLFNQGGGALWVYTPSGSAAEAWRPTISSYPHGVAPGNTYSISGTQFNGLSQASGYGDDAWAPTNYPLVRITNNATGHVFYCRTFGHSTMGVATGSTPVSTSFTVPPGIDLGPSTIEVVANGIPSLQWPVFADDTAPVITGSADQTLLWPPTGRLVTVKVTGQITDAGSGVDPTTAKFTVIDEYGQVQPSGAISLNSDGTFTFTVQLEASRHSGDKSGRQYTIRITVSDNAGNPATFDIIVTVPHDRGHGK